MAVRVCAAKGCKASLEGYRPDAITCSPRCRARRWKERTDYRDRRGVRNAAQRRSATSPKRSRTRYAVVQVRGAVFEVLGFETAASKRAVLRAFGIADRPDFAVIAERHLPATVTIT